MLHFNIKEIANNGFSLETSGPYCNHIWLIVNHYLKEVGLVNWFLGVMIAILHEVMQVQNSLYSHTEQLFLPL